MHDVIVIGGGLSGLVASIHLNKIGFRVLVVEKKKYPQHKICGEYISNEVLPYLQSLGIDLDEVQPNNINTFRLYAPSGKYVESKLPLGGRGIRRYTLDYLLFTYAQSLGVKFQLEQSVQKIDFQDNVFEVSTQKHQSFQGKVVLGSYGKRSTIDKELNRTFLKDSENYIGVKYYIKKPFEKDLVALYNFDGGYCGAVQVENGHVDVAYLVNQKVFGKYQNLSTFEEEILFKNPSIKNLLAEKEDQDQPFTISNISFAPKQIVKDHILMIGDAAGMIPPLCGNGMAMGIHAAKMAIEAIQPFLDNQTDRATMEQQYQSKWNQQFQYRLKWGRQLHQLMGKPLVSEWAIRTLKTFPFLLPPIVKRTHGHPF